MADMAENSGSSSTGRGGFVIQAMDPAAAVDLIVEAEVQGIAAVWMTTGSTQADAVTLFAGAATRPQRILRGNAIIPTWPRNPVFIAQQVQALEGLAPGRRRLGIGPSTAAAMRPSGVAFAAPLTQRREYLLVLWALLHEGSVEFRGRFVQARARLARPLSTPVMASALQEHAFALCGELADGAISWVCPWAYIRQDALPALRRGAVAAERFGEVMALPLIVGEDRAGSLRRSLAAVARAAA